MHNNHNLAVFLVIGGTIRLPSSSDGIDPLVEDVRIGVGGFSTILPSGSFVKCDNMFQFKGQSNGIKEMAIKKKKTDNDGGGSSYQFKLIAKNINLTDKVSNLAKIDLKIGNNKGSTSVRMNGHLGFS